jgi:hypothetical protein
MRSATILSTQTGASNVRIAHRRLRLRVRDMHHPRRRPLRERAALAHRHGARAPVSPNSRVVQRRWRPSPTLRGFLPLLRH